jgi:CheY-like chemotaxis protein
MRYKKILIVDDSSTSRMIMRRCFEIAGFRDSQYYEAENGLEAISFLQDNIVDLILSDLKMPKMDGTTLIKKLKTMDATRRIPVVVISSIGDDILESQLYQTGVKAVIRKPLSPEKVMETLGRSK